mmetsp:Transcript_38043/g.59335  ORF Transcript_38043/g.59335 Transcript_38043/m.59335 type:complete len:182 (+) Transcript_38043:734-1279(+)
MVNCSQVTVVTASGLPMWDSQDCSGCNLLGKYDPMKEVMFQAARCSTMCVEYLPEDADASTTAEVMGIRHTAKRTYLPDVVVVQCKANALNCELTSSGVYPDEEMPLCVPIIEEFMDIRDMLSRDRKAEQLEKNLQVTKHQAQPLRKQNLEKAKTFRASDSGIKQDALFVAREKLIANVDI